MYMPLTLNGGLGCRVIDSKALHCLGQFVVRLNALDASAGRDLPRPRLEAEYA